MSEIWAKTVFLQVEIAKQHGVSREEQCRAAGFTTQDLSNPEAMIADDCVYRHLEFMMERIDPATYALAVGQAHRASTMGAVGMQLRACANAREAFSHLQRYGKVFNRLTKVELSERGNEATWTELRFGEKRPGSDLAALISMAATLTIMQEIARQKVELRHLALSLTQSTWEGSRSQLEAFFGCSLRMGHPHAELCFSSDLLDHQLESADPEVLNYFTELLQRRECESGRVSSTDNFLDSLRLYLIKRLPSGAPSIDDVASELGLSRRTFQRRLDDEKLNFSELLTELRIQLAESYLQDPQLSCAEIAHFLGYSESNSFFRAFKRWKKLSPQDYREEQKGKCLSDTSAPTTPLC